MTEYLYNTLFTNYAFKKLANNLANPSYPYSPWNLLTVKIGDGDNSTNLDKLSLSRTLYTLNVTEISVGNSSISFTCEIPEELEGIEITEIGLFDTYNGKESLFSYSRVQAVKPDDLGYKLVIELNLTLRTVNFYPNLVKIIVNEYDMATKPMLDNLERVFMWIEANLERIIDYTSDEVGKNLSQVYYGKESKIHDSLYGFAYANKYFNLINKFGTDVVNAFFINYENFLSYSINDMAEGEGYLSIYLKQVTSNGDKIQFNSPSTLSFTARIGEFSDKDTTIINKKEKNVGSYFDFYINNSHLVFSLMGSKGNYVGSCQLTKDDLSFIKSNYVNYIITFNGVTSHPILKLYMDGVEKTLEQTNKDVGKINDLSQIQLRNYDQTGGFENANEMEIKSIVAIDKEVTADEAYFLYITQKQRNIEEY